MAAYLSLSAAAFAAKIRACGPNFTFSLALLVESQMSSSLFVFPRSDLRTEPDQKCLSRKHDPDFDKWQAYFTEGDPSAVAAAAYAGK